MVSIRLAISLMEVTFLIGIVMSTRSVKLNKQGCNKCKAVLFFAEFLTHTFVFATKSKLFKREQYVGKVDLADVGRPSNILYLIIIDRELV